MFSHKLCLERNSFKLTILHDDEPGAMFAYYVYINEERIKSINYVNEDIFSIPADQDGDYSFIYFMRKSSEEIVYETTEVIYYRKPRLADFLCSIPLSQRLNALYDISSQIDAYNFFNSLLNTYISPQSAWEWSASDAKTLIIDICSMDYILPHSSELFGVYENYINELSKNLLTPVVPEEVKNLRSALKAFSEHIANQYDEIVLVKSIYDKDDILFRCSDWVFEELYYSLERHEKTISIKPPWRARDAETIYELIVRTRTERKRIRIPDYLVDAAIQKNTIRGSIEMSSYSEKYTFCFYLHRYHELIASTDWINSHIIEWELDNPGIYSITGYIRYGNEIIHKQSLPVEYFPEDVYKEFDDFMRRADGAVSSDETLAFTPLEAPYFDMVLISGRAELDILDALGMKTYQLRGFDDRANIFITNGKMKLAQNKSICFFSGYVKIDGEIYAYEPEKSAIPTEKMNGAAGNFNLVEVKDDEILFTRDFYGFCQYYYYRDESRVVVSNRYHLMLSTLKALKVPMSLNIDVTMAKLSTVSLTLLEQHVSKETNVNGIYQLDLYNDLAVTPQGIKLIPNAVSNILENTDIYHNEDYLRLLDRARDDVLNNIELILKDTRYERVVLDLSGGLDSRTVFAAFTNMPQNLSSRAYIKTNRSSLPRELPVATAIQKLYGYPYDTGKVTYLYHSVKETDKKMRSFYMGGVQEFHLTMLKLMENNNASLIGACGEAMRPYMMLKYFGTYLEKLSDVNEFGRCYTRESAIASIVDYKKGFNAFEELLIKEMKRTPVSSTLKKFSMHYILFGHGFHFSSMFKKILGINEWGPMNSPVMLKANMLAHDEYKGIKFHFDLLYKLNPVMLSVPFEDPDKNSELTRMKEHLIRDVQYLNDLKITENDDMRVWKEAQSAKDKNRRVEFSEQRKIEAADKAVVEDIDYMNKALDVLLNKVLKTYPVLLKTQGCALYFFIQQNRGDINAVRRIYNKIREIADISDIIRSPA